MNQFILVSGKMGWEMVIFNPFEKNNRKLLIFLFIFIISLFSLYIYKEKENKFTKMEAYLKGIGKIIILMVITFDNNI